MAYVIWRVLMKKYTKMTIGIQKNFQMVTPTGRHVRTFEESSWKALEAPSASPVVLDPDGAEPSNKIPERSETPALTRGDLRKSKTKRVKNYLKKCKDVLGASSSKSTKEDLTTNVHEAVFQDVSKEVASKSSWYVTHGDNEGTDEQSEEISEYFETSEIKTPTDGDISITDSLKCVTSLSEDTVEYFDCESVDNVEVVIACVDNVEKEVLSDVDEELKCEVGDKEEIESVECSEVLPLNGALAEIEIGQEIIEEGDQLEEAACVLSAVSIEEICGDVATLVDSQIGPLYLNFATTRPVLIRQARDLLVCTYHGDLAQFRKEFITPAVALLEDIRHHCALTRNAAGPVGWPLCLGSHGISLHLGELDPTLLRHRDCYLCVRPSRLTSSDPTSCSAAPETTNQAALFDSCVDVHSVEVVLVWRHDGDIHSSILADQSSPGCCLDSPLYIEMAAEEDVGTLLQNMLVSVEHAIERIPLDDLSFPCPQCHECVCNSNNSNSTNHELSVCKCVCQQVDPSKCHNCDGKETTCRCFTALFQQTSIKMAQKRDSGIQTSPMFELVGSIPHIDSDEDEESSREAGLQSSVTGIMSKLPHDIVPPKAIKDLPEKLLMSGITFPGTCDLFGSPLIVFEAAAVARASLNCYEVAAVLLYYSSLASKEKADGSMAVLVLCDLSSDVTATWELLDTALMLLVAHVTIDQVIIWKPSGVPDQLSTSNSQLALLKAKSNSSVKCTIVDEESTLFTLISKEECPASCGGSVSHDQLEWIEFYKEYESFMCKCHSCGRHLMTAMSEMRVDDTQTQPSRRLLHHQHRALSRALMDPDLQSLRKKGLGMLERLEERAQWLGASRDVKGATRGARRLFSEVDRAVKRLEQLTEQRREKLRELARVRALEEESLEVLSWIRKSGEETLQKFCALHLHAGDIEDIKKQEQEFEQFYFISMRHLDRGSDLFEEANKCSNLKDTARTLKQHLRSYNDRLETSRERLEDITRCYYLLDKVQLEKNDENSNAEMMTLASKLGNDRLLDKCAASVKNTSQQRLIESCPGSPSLQRNVCKDKSKNSQPDKTNQETRRSSLECFTPPLNKGKTNMSDSNSHPQLPDQCETIGLCKHDCQNSKMLTSTPEIKPDTQRNNQGGFSCMYGTKWQPTSCWDVDDHKCSCGKINTSRIKNLDEIKELRESCENLLDGHDITRKIDSGISDNSSGSDLNEKSRDVTRSKYKKQLNRSCSCQFYEESCAICGNSQLNDGQEVDTNTEGSEECRKSSETDELEDEQYGSSSNNKMVPPVSVNSHLHCHSSTLDIPQEEEGEGYMDPKIKKTLLLIMREMIQTERDYVKSLDYIIENYIPELQCENIPQVLRGQRNVVFGNVEKIYEFHNQHFLRELEKCELNPLQVGQSFLRHEKKFYLYALYNKNKPKSDSLMSEYGTTFFKTKQLELEDKMDLASYLLKPVQRMGKYALLLQQLMKAFPVTTADREISADLEELKLAEQMVRFQLRHGNDLLAMDSLRDCDVNVKEQGRLLRQNEFLVWEGKGGKKSLRQVFLFEELILFSKARRFPDRKNLDLYIYKNSIKTSDIGLTARVGDSSTKFEIWFRKRKPNDTFTLQSMTEEVNKAWTEEISQLLWKQAMRNREVRLAEMSSMGIGNKPCLDIRPSVDQISDRSISIAQLSKTAPRFRNSIAGPVLEMCRNHKRPHSIISVSSISSGGESSTSSGSHSGASATGSMIRPSQSHHSHDQFNKTNMNLRFESTTSPRLHHRSTTLNSQCSMESGIIADISLGPDECQDNTGHGWPLSKSASSSSAKTLSTSTRKINITTDLNQKLSVVDGNGETEAQILLYQPDINLSINL